MIHFGNNASQETNLIVSYNALSVVFAFTVHKIFINTLKRMNVRLFAETRRKFPHGFGEEHTYRLGGSFLVDFK
jgi:hypothetical protein